jgi:thymidylate synthase
VITTFQPLTDTAYVPCVCLLDLFVEPCGLSLVAYCHSIDFRTKGFANLVELAHLQRRVADGVGAPVGELTMVVKSAHVYADDLEATRAVLEVGS